MKKSSDDDAVLSHAVEQSVFVNEQFAERRLANLRYDPPAFRERRQTVRHFESAGHYANRTVEGTLSDAAERFVEGGLG